MVSGGLPRCCNSRRAQLAMAEADLAVMARRAARNPGKYQLRQLTQIQARLASAQAMWDEHLDDHESGRIPDDTEPDPAPRPERKLPVRRTAAPRTFTDGQLADPGSLNVTYAEAAQLTAVPVPTIRQWRSRHLLDPVARSDDGLLLFRLADVQAAERSTRERPQGRRRNTPLPHPGRR